MSPTILSILPSEGTKIILNKLPSRRMKDVISKRFGLKGGRKLTLEAIGKEYKITRERVRQIEVEALKHLRKEENRVDLAPLVGSVEEHIKNHGEVMAEKTLLAGFAPGPQSAHLLLLLATDKTFRSLSETDRLHPRWAVNKNEGSLQDKIINSLEQELEKSAAPVSKDKLITLVSEQVKKITGQQPAGHILDAYLNCSKAIMPNPYGEFGLVHWPAISPRGIKDKAYVALTKAGKPLHFREVARVIDEARWSKKKSHPQTVHNELIKDKRFVLVGRGLYALREWGYEPGVVRDILVSVFKKASRPLSRDEAVQLVLEKRMVKAPTVFLNLQNKSLFKKTSEGKFTLV